MIRRLLAPTLALALVAAPAAGARQGPNWQPPSRAHLATAPLSLHQARAAATRLVAGLGGPPSSVHLCQAPPTQPQLGCWVTVPARYVDPNNPAPYQRVLVRRRGTQVCASLALPSMTVAKCWGDLR